MRNFMFGQEYYLTNYDEINEYLNFIINDDKDKQIKYIFSNEVLSWRDTNHGKRYEISPEFFIVFDNDAVLKINYNFYSLMYIEYMWIQNLNINDKKYNNDEFKLDLDVVNARIESFKVEKFEKEYEINPSSGTMRPEGGNYFKQIVLNLSNESNLCLCAQDAESDGYCDVWIENNIEKITRNMFNDNGTANASWIREWAVTWLNRAEGEENNGLIPFNVQRFNCFSLAYHHDLDNLAGLWGFKDINGNVIIEPKYLFEPIEINGLYILCIGSGWEKSSEWTEGKLWSKVQKWGVLDKDFNIVIPFEYDEICYLEDEGDENEDTLLFACYKYRYEETHLKWVTIFDKDGTIIIPEKYNDVDYNLYSNQLIIYKNRERWGYDDSKGYAGVYDFNLNKVIIEPNTYRDLDYLDYNLFIASNDVENSYNATIINDKMDIIGKAGIWDLVFINRNNSKYKFKGKTMDKKYYYFNIKDEQMIDMQEISEEELEKSFN